MRASFLRASFTAAALLAVARPAHADDPAIPPPPPVDEPEPVVSATARAETPPASPPLTRGRRKHWYGGETLAADGASVLVFSLGATSSDAREQTVLLAGGLASFALAAPIVHAAHGRWGVAAGDVGIRAGALLVGSVTGGLIGAALGSGSSPGWGGAELDGLASGLAIGATLGALSATVLDATVLARERVPPQQAETVAFAWSPLLRPVRDGAVVGVSGTF